MSSTPTLTRPSPVLTPGFRTGFTTGFTPGFTPELSPQLSPLHKPALSAQPSAHLSPSSSVQDRHGEAATLEAQTLPAPRGLGGREQLAAPGARHVVVVEDDPDTLFLLQRTLQDGGYRVTAVADGVSGLVAARREPPDLVILDMAIPGFDGLEVCTALRLAGLTVPVILLTGTLSVDVAIAARRAGVNQYLVKTVGTHAILEHVRCLLDEEW